MQAADIRLGKVLANNQVFVIPLFQRPYVWERERNWEPLWSDVRHAAEEVEAEATSAVSFDPPTYFLGAVVTQERRRAPQRLASANVIDGQQRLSTLQVLFAAARSVASGLGLESTSGRFEGLVENSGKAVHENHPQDRHKLVPLPQDRVAYLWAVRPSDGTKPPSEVHRMVLARQLLG